MTARNVARLPQDNDAVDLLFHAEEVFTCGQSCPSNLHLLPPLEYHRKPWLLENEDSVTWPWIRHLELEPKCCRIFFRLRKEELWVLSEFRYERMHCATRLHS